jgi:hypothetical protein
MTKKIGWDQLLKIRSEVFVMEDEYRNEKPEHPKNRNASTDGLRGTPDPPATNGEASEGEGVDEDEEEKEEKPADSESLAPTLTNGDKDEGLEKPSNTVDPAEVKKGEAEGVS